MFILNSRFIKNYFIVFITIYIIVLFTKIIFALYLSNKFLDISFLQQIYGIFWGYRFDFAISGLIAFIVSLFSFNKRLSTTFFLFFIILTTCVQIADIMYFYESSRHIGYEVNDIFLDTFSLLSTAFSQHKYLILSLFISIALLSYIAKCLNKRIMLIKLSWAWFLQMFMLLLLTTFFIRGTTLIGIPLDPWQSNQIGNNKLADLSMNALYNITYLLVQKNSNIKPIHFNNSINTLNKLYPKNEKTPIKPMLNRPNIVMFFLESWSGVDMHSYGFAKTTTPFFDDILKKSIRPQAMIAGGHRTSEGLFTTLTSLQNPLGQSVAHSQLQNYSYNSILDIFNKDNYYTAFYQGTSKETSGVGSFAQKLGFKKSFGKRDVKNKIYENNSWGVQDPDLYNFVKHNLKDLDKPFFIGINGATTHDDEVPEAIKKIKFSDDDKFNKELNALHFSDMALKQFVEYMQKQYPNTLFIFFADHVGGISGNSFQNYLIPFAMYHKDINPKYYDYLISQRDISPTVLDMVYGNYRKLMPSASGKSLISDNKFFADYYHHGILGWIEGNLLLEYNNELKTKGCYKIIKFNKVPASCNPTYNDLLNNLISFTKYSQQLLFNGTTKEFGNNLLIF